ncbi:MAG: hypothetical protein KKG33_11030 [candidate division Zixibacteria bacterium]|nr:hypothetical protein [candidate division Zixibacteria bacterium]
MDFSRYILKAIYALCAISILLLLYGYTTDTSYWGLVTAKSLNGLIFYPMMAAGILLLFAAWRHATTDSSLLPDAKPLPGSIGLAGAAAAVVIIWIFASGGFFWRNIFSGPLSMFGSYADIIKSYSDLPPNFELTDLWEQTGAMRLIVALLGGLYVFLLYQIARGMSDDKRESLLAFFFMAASGVLAIFTSANDFAVVAVLMALVTWIALIFLKGRIPIYVLGIVLVFSVFFHPLLVMFALALLYVKLAGSFLRNGKPGIPLVLLIGMALLGIGLSLLQSFPFTSVFMPASSASELFTSSHLWGAANQLLFVSHLIVLIALLSVIYMFVRCRVTHLHGMLFGSWFVMALAFYLFTCSNYGWVLGYASSAIVVVPALFWITYVITCLETASARRAFAFLAVTNALVTIPLLVTVHSSEDVAERFSRFLARENAFDARFEDGKNALLLGTMYAEHFELYDDAVAVLAQYHRRYPLDIVGRYEYGWAQSNATTDQIDGIDMMKKLEIELIESNKLFWEFNYRMGTRWLLGNNHTFASIALERAAAEKNTADIAKLLGGAYMTIRVLDSMVSKFKQAIALGDSSQENFYSVAFGAEQLNDSITAMEYYKCGISLFPAYVPNYQYVARYYFLTGKYDSLEALATQGMEHVARSPELEACMILVYHYSDRPEQRDSLYESFMDFFRTQPEALNQWGIFLEENGMVYEGRKMQAADVSMDSRSLHTVLNFYNYYKETNRPDSARIIIDRFIDANPEPEIMEVLQAVRRYDTIIWPKSE